MDEFSELGYTIESRLTGTARHCVNVDTVLWVNAKVVGFDRRSIGAYFFFNLERVTEHYFS